MWNIASCFLPKCCSYPADIPDFPDHVFVLLNPCSINVYDIGVHLPASLDLLRLLTGQLVVV